MLSVYMEMKIQPHFFFFFKNNTPYSQDIAVASSYYNLLDIILNSQFTLSVVNLL